MNQLHSNTASWRLQLANRAHQNAPIGPADAQRWRNASRWHFRLPIPGALPSFNPSDCQQVFLDVVESVNLLVNSNGSVVRSEVVGALKMRTYLSGMPECKLGLNDKVGLERRGRGCSTSLPPSLLRYISRDVQPALEDAMCKLGLNDKAIRSLLVCDCNIFFPCLPYLRVPYFSGARAQARPQQQGCGLPDQARRGSNVECCNAQHASMRGQNALRPPPPCLLPAQSVEVTCRTSTARHSLAACHRGVASAHSTRQQSEGKALASGETRTTNIISTLAFSQAQALCCSMSQNRGGDGDRGHWKMRHDRFLVPVAESIDDDSIPAKQVLFESQGRGGKGKAVDLEDMKFHQCVRLARFENDRTISFIPPDGAFDLMCACDFKAGS